MKEHLDNIIKFDFYSDDFMDLMEKEIDCIKKSDEKDSFYVFARLKALYLRRKRLEKIESDNLVGKTKDSLKLIQAELEEYIRSLF